MKKNIDSNFAIAILALVAACVGFSFWFLSTSTDLNSLTIDIDDQVVEQEIKTSADSLLSTKDWEVYSDSDAGFSFRYPQRYTFQKHESRNHPPGYVLLSDTQAVCHPITLTKYRNPNNLSNVLDLPVSQGDAMASIFSDIHADYHYKNSQEITINDKQFIFSDRMPYVIAAATILDNWVVELFTTDQYGGAYIEDECEAIYQTALSTFTVKK